MHTLKHITTIAVVAIVVVALSACESKEERVISELDSIEQTMEKSGEELDAQEWDELIADYKALKEEAEGCKFTPEQMKELGRIESKIVVAYTKRKAKDIGESIQDFLNGASDYIEGFSEGLEEMSREDEDDDDF